MVCLSSFFTKKAGRGYFGGKNRGMSDAGPSSIAHFIHSQLEISQYNTMLLIFNYYSAAKESTYNVYFANPNSPFISFSRART